VTYDGSLALSSRFKIFVDGVDVTNTSSANSAGTLGATTFNPSHTVLGGWGQYSNVTVDELAIWNVALSSTQAQNLYTRGVARLKYQVRTCDDGSCIGESWRGFDNTTTSYFDTSLNILKSFFSATIPWNFNINRYVQYRVEFESDDGLVTPKLERVDVRGAD
jgi:hypothetical protein